jgi:hypothetical protein
VFIIIVVDTSEDTSKREILSEIGRDFSKSDLSKTQWNKLSHYALNAREFFIVGPEESREAYDVRIRDIELSERAARTLYISSLDAIEEWTSEEGEREGVDKKRLKGFAKENCEKLRTMGLASFEKYGPSNLVYNIVDSMRLDLRNRIDRAFGVDDAINVRDLLKT